MNDDDDKKLPAIQNRIIGAAVEIDQDDPLGIVYQHSLFCQVVLPRSRPEGRVFERSYRNGSISLEAGKLWDGTRWIEQPLPAGPKPRLALIHINSQAVKTRSPYVDIGHSCAEFLRRLGLNDQSGNTYTLFKRQMKALAACRMTLGFTVGNEAVTLDTKPIEEFRAWMATEQNRLALWPTCLELSRKYLASLLEHAVPLDTRAVSALAHSAMALDAYSFLARRLYTLEKPVKVTWHQFHAQFGHEYNCNDPVKEFRKRFLPAVRAALTVYPSAKVVRSRGRFIGQTLLAARPRRIGGGVAWLGRSGSRPFARPAPGQGPRAGDRRTVPQAVPAHRPARLQGRFRRFGGQGNAPRLRPGVSGIRQKMGQGQGLKVIHRPKVIHRKCPRVVCRRMGT